MPVEALLLACLHQDPGRLDAVVLDRVATTDWDLLLASATNHRVRPFVYRRLVDQGCESRVPVSTWEGFKRGAWRTAERSVRLQAAVAAIAHALAEQHIPVAALKGVHLAQAVYANPALREMNDADILVRREDARGTVDVLVAMGYVAAKPFSLEYDLSVSNHVTPLHKDGLTVEVHCSLARPGTRDSIDPSGLWTRAIPFRIGAATMLALGPEDLLLHLCHHAAYHHRFEFGLRAFCDIAATVRRFQDELDWRVVEQRSQELHWHRGVFLALRLARGLVGATVPDGVLELDREPAITEMATAQVLSDKIILNTMTPEFARLYEAGGLATKLRHLRRRIFLPRAKVAAAYLLPPNSPRVALAYIRRVCDLAAFYGWATVRSLFTREPTRISMVARKNQLRKWLDNT